MIQFINQNIQAFSIISTITLAFIGYLVSYFNNKITTSRKDKLEYINKQLNEFYGPLYVITQSGEIVFDELKKDAQKRGLEYPNQDSPKKKTDLSQWEIWVKDVFMPMNERLEEVIIDKSYLIIEEEIPDCIKKFIAHNAGYKVLLRNWEYENYEKNRSMIAYPKGIIEYAQESFEYLKAEQKRLIGKLKKG